MKGKFNTFIYKIPLLLCCLLFAQQGMTQTCDTTIYESFDGVTTLGSIGWTTQAPAGSQGAWTIDDELISTAEPLGDPVPSDRIVIRDNNGNVDNSSSTRSVEIGGLMDMEAVTLSFSYVYNDRVDVANPNDSLELYITKIGLPRRYWNGSAWVPETVAWLKGEDAVGDFSKPIPSMFYADNAPFRVRFNYKDGTQGGTGGGRGVSIDDFTICGSLSCDLEIDESVPLDISEPSDCGGLGELSLVLSAAGVEPYMITLSGSPSYTVSNTGGATILNLENIPFGTYTNIIVEDSKGCTDEWPQTITINDPSPFSNDSLSSQNPTCEENNGTISAPAGYSYLWSSNANNATTQEIDGLGDGTYTVTITDSGTTCTTTMSTTFTNVGQAVEINSIDTLSDAGCNMSGGLVVDASGGPGTTYLWSNNASNAITPSITNLAPDTYSVTVSNGLCQDMGMVVLGAGPQPTISVTSQTDLQCAGDKGSITVNVTGGAMGTDFDYDWESPNGFSVSNDNEGNSNTQSGLAAGVYTITVTDAKSCTDEITVTLEEPTQITITEAMADSLSCFGASDGSISLTMTGGNGMLTYSWNNDMYSGGSISNLPAGDYVFSVSDENGCSITGTIPVGQPQELTSSITTVVDVSCNAGSDGSLTTTAMGGTPPYSYIWSNSETTATITGLTAVDYFLTITDDKGCMTVSSASIMEPDALSGDFVVDSIASCEGIMDGSATVIVSGGILPYSYAWSTPNGNGDTDTMITAGDHSVSITDANNCEFIINGTVLAEDPIMLSNDSAMICFGQDEGAIALSITGRVGPFGFAWSDGQNTQNISGLNLSSYSVTVTDNSSGCTAEETFTIPRKPSPLAFDDIQITSGETVNVDLNDYYSGTGTEDPSYTYDLSSIDQNCDVLPNEENGETDSTILEIFTLDAEATAPGVATYVVTPFIQYTGGPRCEGVASELKVIILPIKSNPLNIPNVVMLGMEDYWDIRSADGEADLENYSMKIFNRNGAMIHESTLNEKWTGTSDGSLVQEGVYYYIIEGKEDGFIGKGSVLLQH